VKTTTKRPSKEQSVSDTSTLVSLTSSREDALVKPDPLTPPDCDLRAFRWMPLDVGRLRDIDEVVLPSAEAFRAAVLLWCASWHQIPAASLPNDERILAKLAGYGRDVASWAKVRDDVLHGFIECSDGRLYHPVVAEKALEAAAQRKMQKERTQKATEARRGGKRDAKPDGHRNVERNDNRDDDDPSNRHDPPNEIQKTRQDKTRQDSDREREKENSTTTTESLERESAVLEQTPSAAPPDSLSDEGVSKVLKKVLPTGLKAVGHPLPETWTPDDELCADVKRDFGMTDENIRAELIAFHAYHAHAGSLSAKWRAGFVTWCKRWKDHRDKQAAPRVELMQHATPTTEAEWDAVATMYAKTGWWSRHAGSDPTLSSCRCPRHILERHGINRETGERQIAPRKVPA
jgi:hypothetical protein